MCMYITYIYRERERNIITHNNLQQGDPGRDRHSRSSHRTSSKRGRWVSDPGGAACLKPRHAFFIAEKFQGLAKVAQHRDVGS